MDFLTFLGDYENENVSDVKELIESTKKTQDLIISESFRSKYPSKKEAFLNLERVFRNKETAPKGIDPEYINEHLGELKAKIKSLTEGDIRIIIHNHEDSKGGGGMELGMEAATPKKRGRPPKVVEIDEAPKNTGVVNAVGDTSSVVETDVEEDVVLTKEPESKIERGEEKEVKAVIKKEDVGLTFEEANEKLELSEKKEALLTTLEALQLSEEELKKATDAAKGVIEEGEELTEKISEASDIIKQISEMK